METCNDCVHQTVCKVHGELIKTRNDVEKVCDHYIHISVLGCVDYWKQKFEKENR